MAVISAGSIYSELSRITREVVLASLRRREEALAQMEQELVATTRILRDHNEVCAQIEREVFVARPDQHFQLLTIANQQSYPCPLELTRVDESWIDDNYHYWLRHITPEAMALAGIHGRPTVFCLLDRHLHFWPIPDQQYRIGFVQHAERPAMVQGVYSGYGVVTNADYYAAREKSLALLKEWLSPSQLKEYEQTNSFEVVGCHTGKRYRILQSTVFNVSPLGTNQKLCFVPENAESVGDIMLAQKIALETDEKRALVVANKQA